MPPPSHFFCGGHDKLGRTPMLGPARQDIWDLGSLDFQDEKPCTARLRWLTKKHIFRDSTCFYHEYKESGHTQLQARHADIELKPPEFRSTLNN